MVERLCELCVLRGEKKGPGTGGSSLCSFQKTEYCFLKTVYHKGLTGRKFWGRMGDVLPKR